eukprot:SAG22_NODE_5143_length_1078_cov_1.289070_1_plen_50_part_10
MSYFGPCRRVCRQERPIANRQLSVSFAEKGVDVLADVLASLTKPSPRLVP